MSGSRWRLGVLLCLILWSAPALAQSEVWHSLNSAGSEAYQQGDYAEAEKWFTAALEIAERPNGYYQGLATSLNNLAVLYQVQGRIPEAESLYKRALAIFEKPRGLENRYVATSLNNLA